MTRVRLLVIALVVFAAGCGSNSTAPSPANPNTFVFTAQLLPANETPPVTNAEASGKGTATITLVVTKDSSNVITAATVTFQVTLSGFPANTTLTAAHIHEAAAGVPGAVKVNTTLANGEVVLTDGSGGFTKTTAAAADVAQGMINNPAGYYFNVHTPSNANGVARGQLVKQ